MRRAKFIFVALALLIMMVAGSAPAMAQDGWDDDYWYPGFGYYGYYDDVYDEFEEDCLGITSGGECTGVGSDLDEYYSEEDFYDYLDEYYYDNFEDFYDYLDEYYD